MGGGRRVAIAVGGVALVGVAVVVFLGPRGILFARDAPAEPAPRWAPPAEPPVAADPAGPGLAGIVDSGWAERISAATGIPERALLAYAAAALVKAAAMPDCGLSWATLAGIGAVESDHGRHGGAAMARDGTVAPPILGVALDGDGTAHIPDSDGGEFDGDAEFDRAIGPMQLIPEAWRNWHVDGDGDGVEDPHDIDDAATAAANYLCRASTTFLTEEGWRTGIAAYNSAPSYLDAVARAAVSYAGAG
jgi:membrane-bound lytic murein transglycosylase B